VPNRVPEQANAGVLTGDPRTLAARLGSPALLQSDGTDDHAIVLPKTAIELRQFILAYRDTILGPQELPVILKACELASHGHARELIQLDQEWTASSRTRAFAEASMAVGRRQLSRLRPLRDQRVIQRYATAVDAGSAKGWHVIVYGVALSVFSVPQRSGLSHYAQLTLGSFIDSAPTNPRLTDTDKQQLRRELELSTPELLARALPSASALRAI
jgi:urease accessory protein UreF